ncbi:hypothetical protein GCM10009085_45090 [Pseudomonas avellanae]|nr:hypothetical protein GCM10009085_45090 [Pseudomonas avellanae]
MTEPCKTLRRVTADAVTVELAGSELLMSKPDVNELTSILFVAPDIENNQKTQFTLSISAKLLVCCLKNKCSVKSSILAR